MHWVTIAGIIFIALGTFLTYVGQNISSKTDVANLQLSIGEKNAQIDNLAKGNEELLRKIDQYQKTVNEKDEKIDQLETEVNKLSITSPKLLPDGRIAASEGITMTSEYSKAASKIRTLFNDRNFDEAYRVAEDLFNKVPNFGLACFLIGTIEVERGNMSNGEEFLAKAIELELTDSDRAWALHNLGIIALRQQNISKASGYFKNAIRVNPKMEESKKTLASIEKQLSTNK